MLNNKKKRSNLEMFMKLITGYFNNKEQFEEMQKAGKIYPYASMLIQSVMTRLKIFQWIFRESFL